MFRTMSKSQERQWGGFSKEAFLPCRTCHVRIRWANTRRVNSCNRFSSFCSAVCLRVKCAMGDQKVQGGPRCAQAGLRTTNRAHTIRLSAGDNRSKARMPPMAGSTSMGGPTGKSMAMAALVRHEQPAQISIKNTGVSRSRAMGKSFGFGFGCGICKPSNKWCELRWSSQSAGTSSKSLPYLPEMHGMSADAFVRIYGSRHIPFFFLCSVCPAVRFSPLPEPPMAGESIDGNHGRSSDNA